MTRLPADSILDLLSSLVDKSLVVYEEHDGAGRYRLLETVRQYAAERLAESGEAEAVQGRAADWFLSLAEEAEPQLTGPEQGAWLKRLETEHDNLRASLTWYEQSNENAEAGLRLSGALQPFWSVRGHLSEGRQWLGRALDRTTESAAQGEGLAGRAKALHGAGVLAFYQGERAGAGVLYEQSLTIYRQLGDQTGIAESLRRLGSVVSGQGDDAGARALYEESLAIQRQLGNQRGIANSLCDLGDLNDNPRESQTLYEESLTLNRQAGDQQGIAGSLLRQGVAAYRQGDYAGARALHEESLTIQRQMGNPQRIAIALMGLGGIAHTQGDYAAEWALYAESLTILRQLGDQKGIASSLVGLGDSAHRQGDCTAAWALYEESLTIQRQLGDQKGIACSLEGMAGVVCGQNQPSRAAQLWGAVSSLRETIGSNLSFAEQAEIDKLAASLREALSEDAFDAAWNAGRAMTLDEAVEFALDVPA